MATFVYILQFSSIGLSREGVHETDRLNPALKMLQENGAKILDVKMDVTFNLNNSETCRTYLIMYERNEPV